MPTTKLNKNLRFLNLIGEDFDFSDMDIELIEEKMENVIILLDRDDKEYLDALRIKQYNYWLSKIANLDKDNPIYEPFNETVNCSNASNDAKNAYSLLGGYELYQEYCHHNLNDTDLNSFDDLMSSNKHHQINDQANPLGYISKISTSTGKITEGQLISSSQGRNRIIYKNGDIFKGLMKSHFYQSGTYISKSTGKLCISHYYENKLHGLCTIAHFDGQKSIGYYKNGVQDGFTTEYFQNGDKFTGLYKQPTNNIDQSHTSYHQIGLFEDSEGDKYIGSFVDLEKEGFGTCYYI